jgi:hypothetical protein
MTLRPLLALQIAFLLAGTSAPGRLAVLGVVVEAYRAYLGDSAVSAGATVYDRTGVRARRLPKENPMK